MTRVAELGFPACIKKNSCRDWSSELCCGRKKSWTTNGQNISSFGHGRRARTQLRLEMEETSLCSVSFGVFLTLAFGLLQNDKRHINEPILVSGDAQVSSLCGMHCGDREQPKSLLLHPPDRGASSLSESDDCTVEVLAGVSDTCGNNSDAATLSCQFCKKTLQAQVWLIPASCNMSGSKAKLPPLPSGVRRLLMSTNVINGKHPLLAWETKREFAKNVLDVLSVRVSLAVILNHAQKLQILRWNLARLKENCTPKL